jgi:hypothetical protein
MLMLECTIKIKCETGIHGDLVEESQSSNDGGFCPAGGAEMARRAANAVRMPNKLAIDYGLKR